MSNIIRRIFDLNYAKRILPGEKKDEIKLYLLLITLTGLNRNTVFLLE